MISRNYRSNSWSRIAGPWDVVVIGGGITGAGILREATRLGLRALLVEQRDFAWGSSSRSSKYVHGGLRYLATGQVHLTAIAVRERERLLAEGPGLVDPLGFLLAVYKGERPSPLIYQVVLAVYDLLGRQWTHRHYGLDDIISTYAGVRPVIGSHEADPTTEVRDHVVWEEAGLLTVTGGKLTTFRRMAVDALRAARHRLPETRAPGAQLTALDRIDPAQPGMAGLDATTRQRLLGRHGARAGDVVAAASAKELAAIPGTRTLWAELHWAARAEAVFHLDDLLLRRTRLGLLLPHGGEAILPSVRAICQPELGWDDARWDAEVSAYRLLWQSCHSLPDRSTIPDWRPMLAEAQARRAVRQS